MKVAVIGPESSGKSVLAKDLAQHFKWPLVAEYARKYLNDLPFPYTEENLEEMAIGQFEGFSVSEKNNTLISDTEILTIKIWSNEKYGRCSDRINELLLQQRFDLYLLCAPDLEWQFDELRESPDLNDRKRQFELFKKELQLMRVDFEVIEGQGKERLSNAINSVTKRLK